MKISNTLERVRNYLREHGEGLVCAYVFGSVGRGEEGAESDIDLAVLLEHDPPGTLAGSGRRLEGDLERALGRGVDVVLLNNAGPDLVHRVLRDGQLVLERSPRARIQFEVKARNAYFDLQPILARYRRGQEAPVD